MKGTLGVFDDIVTDVVVVIMMVMMINLSISNSDIDHFLFYA